ncbi:YveK family protein [Candidatus Enterococcus courvalinii]|uniref:Capsular polysaccharide biosynthesis protein CpsC n=1 Tax=Candidatus Enterococcus courvalinii TaxID=2815329 RepID=A0ABS3HZQ7_9ENTE|nr:Wzz/FepE/Etk N-terminal domain-containing protein [Enterococcus sp. MSG2901]MBO0481021.1 hypothetical protein [Enterococcus sp. MSG2901]
MEYDFQKIGLKLLSYKWLILFFSVAGLVISLMVSTFFIKPQYQMASQVLVIPNNQKQETVTQMINTYNALIKSPRVLNEVNTNLDGRYTLNELKNQITPMTEENSQIINIVVTGATAREAAEIANQVADQFIKTAAEIMSTSQLKLLDKAILDSSTAPISPKKINFAMMELIGGLAFSLVIIALHLSLSTKIKSENDFSNLKVPILGTIGAIDDYEPGSEGA